MNKDINKLINNMFSNKPITKGDIKKIKDNIKKDNKKEK